MRRSYSGPDNSVHGVVEATQSGPGPPPPPLSTLREARDTPSRSPAARPGRPSPRQAAGFGLLERRRDEQVATGPSITREVHGTDYAWRAAPDLQVGCSRTGALLRVPPDSAFRHPPLRRLADRVAADCQVATCPSIRPVDTSRYHARIASALPPGGPPVRTPRETLIHRRLRSCRSHLPAAGGGRKLYRYGKERDDERPATRRVRLEEEHRQRVR